MPLGSDVVDLDLPLNQPDAIHPRFDPRVFTLREIELLNLSSDRHLLRWSMWAAKESAFKAVRKIDPRVRFLPREFEVGVEGDGEPASVSHSQGSLTVWIDRGTGWIHALASQREPKPCFTIEGRPPEAQSLGANEPGDLARQLACRALGEHQGISSGEIRIVDIDRIPYPESQGVTMPFDLSLSHDGRFVACAWEPLEPPEAYFFDR